MSAEEAVNAYNRAVFILKTYNQDIEYIIDEAVNEIKPETWDEVRRKTRSKHECIRRAQEMADEATRDINKLKEIVSRWGHCINGFSSQSLFEKYVCLLYN